MTQGQPVNHSDYKVFRLRGVMHWSQTAQHANRADYKSERYGTENKSLSNVNISEWANTKLALAFAWLFV